jgi:hypothetical protein
MNNNDSNQNPAGLLEYMEELSDSTYSALYRNHSGGLLFWVMAAVVIIDRIAQDPDYLDAAVRILSKTSDMRFQALSAIENSDDKNPMDGNATESNYWLRASISKAVGQIFDHRALALLNEIARDMASTCRWAKTANPLVQ